MKKYINIGIRFSFVLIVFEYLNPINNGLHRLLLLGSILVVLLLLLYYFRKKKNMLRIYSGILFICFIFLLNPREIKIEDFRTKYVNHLLKFKDCDYVWGGENSFGIDCSGLMRKALIDTYRQEGIFNFNGYALRKSIEHWWFDYSAKAMRDEYRKYTLLGSQYDNLKVVDYDLIEKGDIAVTARGVHILGYIGNKSWIHAEPTANKVIIENVSNPKSSWFDIPIYILKWNDIIKNEEK